MADFKKRGAGVLLHISSLAGEYGIGSLGKEAYAFVDFLQAGGQRYWQILPLTPIGFTNSPYQSYSAFAYNHFFIDLELLYEKGLLLASELAHARRRNNGTVDFEYLFASREELLYKAFCRFDANDEQFSAFVRGDEQLEYACYMTLKKQFDGKPWYEWQDEYRSFGKKTLKKIKSIHPKAVMFYQWLQFIFLQQWQRLKQYAGEKGIKLIGDMPIYLDYDSVECWSNPRLVQIDEEYRLKAVAGVPPDYFSADGQLWGNPLYDWDYHQSTNFLWWKKRIAALCRLCDYIRIDHFRGFCRYYSIPSGSTTAREGCWRDGPATSLFEVLPKRIKNRIIAEDLGYLEERTLEFFQSLSFPGMKVLQFAFDGNSSNPHLPQNYTPNCVVYSGTHDNDTLLGWLSSLKDSREVKQRIKASAKELSIIAPSRSSKDYIRLIIQIAYASVSSIAIIPIQDFLEQKSNCRMNTPGTLSSKNWAFRLEQRLPHSLSQHLKSLAIKWNR